MVKKENASILKGKGKKALNRLKAIEEDLSCIKQYLHKTYKILSQDIKKFSYLINESKKQYTIEGVPERITFKYNGLVFYIDFTVVPYKNGHLTDIQGKIVYGARREVVQQECVSEGKDKKYSGKTICTRIENKAFIHFLVNQHGMIQSNEMSEEEWWIETKNEKKNECSDVLDFHYRAIDLIWSQALDWVNENILA